MKQRRNWRGWTIQQLSAKISTRSASHKQPRGGATTGASANIGEPKTANRIARLNMEVKMGRLDDVEAVGAHTASYVQHFIVVNIFKCTKRGKWGVFRPTRRRYRNILLGLNTGRGARHIHKGSGGIQRGGE